MLVPRSLRRALGLATVVGIVALGACRTLPPAPDPVPAAASEAFGEAREHWRSSAPDRARLAREAAERAHSLAPDWIAPQRMLDDLDREELLSVDRLRARLLELDQRPDDAGLCYLTARLQGDDGADLFERALKLDPSLAWAHHGMAWVAASDGRYDRAVARQRDALARARDTWERSFFTSALAGYLAIQGAADEARALLQERQTAPDVRPADRVELALQAVLLGLDQLDRGVRFGAYTRGLELLREGALTDGEVDRLVLRMRRVGSNDDPAELELLGALAAAGGPACDRWRAEILLDREPSPLALGLLERSFDERSLSVPGGPLMRSARFAAAQFEAGVEAWLADLPAVVLTEEGLPHDPRLREVVLRSRRLGSAPKTGAHPFGPAEELAAFGEALNQAGWFREARSVAGWLAAHDLDRALELEREALAGQELIESLRRLIYDLDLRPSPDVASASRSPASGESASRRAPADGDVRVVRPIDDVDDLLGAMGPLFARAHETLGGETDPEAVGAELESSPRMAYGPVGALVHPGPRFSALDQRAGRGTDGTSVPGLAREMDRLSRFALVGQVLGGNGPDATVLTRLQAVEREGEHLGVPWSGTVVWCEGADVLGRASRAGAQISGAALHEGYWVDVAVVRLDLERWELLRRDFDSGDPAHDAERVQRVLGSRGLSITDESAKSRQEARRRVWAVLGEGQRVRLAVLADRAGAGEVLGTMTLDELVDVTAVHEEGHLTDRTRFLPLGKNLGGALEFLLQAGFSPRGIVQQLEYRAQLVALCATEDPRVPLAQVLDASEPGLGFLTAHGRAYRKLLVDWLQALERLYERDPEGWPELDPDQTFVHQLHALGPERVREVSEELAERRGMLRR